MIDNETYRIRVGLFATKRPRNRQGSSTYDSTTFNSAFGTHSLPFIHDDTPTIIPLSNACSSFLVLFYSLFITYFWPILLACTVSFPRSLNVLDLSKISFAISNHRFLIPSIACINLKILCAIICSVGLKNPRLSEYYTRACYPNRFMRLISYCIVWAYLVNFLLITIVNPSMLNPGPQSLSLAYQNVQGLIPFSDLSSKHPLLNRNKILELQTFAVNHRPDIIALNETWLKKSIHNNEILPDTQYEIFRNDRTRKTHPQDPDNPNKFRENGGGVLLAIRSDLDATTKRLSVSLGMEMIAVQISFPNNERIIVCTCYRVGTLGHPHLDTFTSYIRSLVSRRNPPKVYIVGDFNLPHADWSSSSSHIPIEQSFIDCFNDLSFNQFINSPTHISGNKLDILLSNSDNSIENISILDPHSICKSDHFPITFKIKKSFSRKKTPKRTVYNFKKADWAAMNRELCSLNWQFLSSYDPDTSWNILKTCLLNLADRNIPKVRIKSEFQPPWFDSELFSACREKDRCRQKFKESESLLDELKFVTSRKNFKKLSSTKIRDNLFNNDDPALITKKFWAHVKYQSNSCRIPNCVSYDNQLRFKPQDQAELFNKYFFDQFSEPSLYDVDVSYVNDTDYDIEFDHRIVRKLLSDINSNKAQGPDGIHGKILKNCAVGLAFPLTCIFKTSYNCGYIPQEWKMANVVPIFKKGSKSEVKNYRPISLTCLVMKVFERIIKEKLLSLTDNLLDPRQHGFLEHKSCTTNMVSFCDSLALSLNENITNHVVYFDFAKAFDSVNHDILLYKLKNFYNVDGILLKFLCNYLKDRSQRVVIGSESSSILAVNSGVPQGSILGPLLFVLFINDLPSELSEDTDVVLYADDTKIWRKILSPSDCSSLQTDIDRLINWSSRNKMKFHPSKCKVLAVSSRSTDSSSSFSYNLDGTVLEFVDSEKDLGVDITPKLNWTSQCNRIYSKACQQLGIVRRNRHIVIDVKSRRALYLSLVRSQFENCSIVWRPTTVTLAKKLEGLQERAVKLILSEENCSYSDELYIVKCKSVDVLPLSKKFDMNDLIFFHKVLNNLVPVALPHYLSFYMGGSRLRNCHLDSHSIVCSIIPRFSQQSSRSNNPLTKSFFYRTHLLWNGLPLELRQKCCPSSFKSELIKHLWSSITNDELDSSLNSSSSSTN